MKKRCPLCKNDSLIEVHGCGWDLDMLVCSYRKPNTHLCEFELVLDTTSTNEGFKCPECDATMLTVHNLKTEELFYRCKGCGKKFKDAKE